jgi:hypothetical protein
LNWLRSEDVVGMVVLLVWLGDFSNFLKLDRSTR